jgi:hypothetical protein
MDIVSVVISIVIKFGSIAIAALLSWAAYKGFKKYAEDDLFKQALERLRVGVDVTYEGFVKGLKEDSPGGRKLTKEEREEARQLAYKTAIELVNDPDDPVRQFLVKWTKEEVLSYITRLLQKAKNGSTTTSTSTSTSTDPQVDS